MDTFHVCVLQTWKCSLETILLPSLFSAWDSIKVHRTANTAPLQNSLLMLQCSTGSAFAFQCPSYARNFLRQNSGTLLKWIATNCCGCKLIDSHSLAMKVGNSNWISFDDPPWQNQLRYLTRDSCEIKGNGSFTVASRIIITVEAHFM